MVNTCESPEAETGSNLTLANRSASGARLDSLATASSADIEVIGSSVNFDLPLGHVSVMSMMEDMFSMTPCNKDWNTQHTLVEVGSVAPGEARDSCIQPFLLKPHLSAMPSSSMTSSARSMAQSVKLSMTFWPDSLRGPIQWKNIWLDKLLDF